MKFILSQPSSPPLSAKEGTLTLGNTTVPSSPLLVSHAELDRFGTLLFQLHQEHPNAVEQGPIRGSIVPESDLQFFCTL